jgi:hypothetical protein
MKPGQRTPCKKPVSETQIALPERPVGAEGPASGAPYGMFWRELQLAEGCAENTQKKPTR